MTFDLKCPACQQTHQLGRSSLEVQEDSAGRVRFRFVCPTTGKTRSSFATREQAASIRADARPTQGATPRSRATSAQEPSMENSRVIRGARKLSATIPLVPEVNVETGAGWDVVEGIIDGLMELARSSDSSSARFYVERAKSLKAIARGESNQQDSEEREFGKALAELFGPVLVSRGVDLRRWLALAPPDVRAVTTESSPEVQSAADDLLQGGVGAYAETALNTLLPEGFEVDLSGEGRTTDAFDVGQDVLNLGAGDEASTSLQSDLFEGLGNAAAEVGTQALIAALTGA